MQPLPPRRVQPAVASGTPPRAVDVLRTAPAVASSTAPVAVATDNAAAVDVLRSAAAVASGTAAAEVLRTAPAVASSTAAAKVLRTAPAVTLALATDNAEAVDVLRTAPVASAVVTDDAAAVLRTAPVAAGTDNAAAADNLLNAPAVASSTTAAEVLRSTPAAAAADNLRTAPTAALAVSPGTFPGAFDVAFSSAPVVASNIPRSYVQAPASSDFDTDAAAAGLRGFPEYAEYGSDDAGEQYVSSQILAQSQAPLEQRTGLTLQQPQKVQAQAPREQRTGLKLQQPENVQAQYIGSQTRPKSQAPRKKRTGSTLQSAENVQAHNMKPWTLPRRAPWALPPSERAQTPCDEDEIVCPPPPPPREQPMDEDWQESSPPPHCGNARGQYMGLQTLALASSWSLRNAAEAWTPYSQAETPQPLLVGAQDMLGEHGMQCPLHAPYPTYGACVLGGALGYVPPQISAQPPNSAGRRFTQHGGADPRASASSNLAVDLPADASTLSNSALQGTTCCVVPVPACYSFYNELSLVIWQVFRNRNQVVASICGANWPRK